MYRHRQYSSLWKMSFSSTWLQTQTEFGSNVWKRSSSVTRNIFNGSHKFRVPYSCSDKLKTPFSLDKNQYSLWYDIVNANIFINNSNGKTPLSLLQVVALFSSLYTLCIRNSSRHRPRNTVENLCFWCNLNVSSFFWCSLLCNLPVYVACICHEPWPEELYKVFGWRVEGYVAVGRRHCRYIEKKVINSSFWKDEICGQRRRISLNFGWKMKFHGVFLLFFGLFNDKN